MPNKYGSTTHLIDNDNCEGITTTTNSTKETSIYLDSDDFDVAFENTILSKFLTILSMQFQDGISITILIIK